MISGIVKEQKKKFMLVLSMLVILTFTNVKAEEECSCGMTNPNRIFGGKKAGVNEFPEMAGLKYLLTNELFCGATIIGQKYLLTAAHCVENLDDQLEDLEAIVFGHDSKKKKVNGISKSYKIKKLTIHPEYNEETHENDIAIVTLEKNIEYSMNVGPACLPIYYAKSYFVGETVTAVGSGKLTLKDNKENSLHKVDLKVVPLGNCANTNKITKDMICTKGGKKDTCKGDDGGPLLWHNSKTDNMILVGVITSTRCGDGKSSTHMRVGGYLDFIQKNTPGQMYCKKH